MSGSTMICTGEDLSDLLICKEKELKDLQARQIQFQKTTVEETQKRLHEMHRKFNQLKEDFTYNLKVLEERDRELGRYETLFTQLKMVENAKQAEISDLRIKANKLQHVLAEETKKQEVLQYHYQQKLKEHQLELERLHRSKDADIDQYCEEYENMKRQLERKLQEVEGELALQKQELLVEFDTEIKKRECEFRQKADEMGNILLSHELKVKLLTKELEALREAGIKAADFLEEAGATNLELEKEVKRKDWEIKDLTAVKDAQIHKLESELDSVQLQWKKEKEVYERKHSEMDRFAREKDAILASVKKAHTEQIHKWESQIRELQINKETLEMELHRADWRHTDCLREKETVIEKLEQELKTLRTNWDSQIAQISRGTVSKDLQIQELQEEVVKLKGQLASLLQDIERYKGQLALAAEREEILERAKVQIELDWQRRCENAERNQYQKSEALIQSLTTARDQVTADLQEKEKKLHELEKILSAVTVERDQALHDLQKHGHLPKGTKQDAKGLTGINFPSVDIQKLQEQNNTLRAVIAEMRREMEILNVQTLSSDNIKMNIKDSDRINSTTILFTPDCIQSLEEENRKRKENGQMKDKQYENESEFPEQLFVSSVHLPCYNKSTQTFQQEHIINSDLAQVASETAPKKHDARIPLIGSAGIHMGSLTKRLQEDSEQVKQVLGTGVDDRSLLHIGNPVKLMQRKLKEAARKISSLSKEKQQLLEMVNRLRAELGTASKEGSQDSKNSRHSRGSTSSRALYPKELVRGNKHHLLALEHLQYQLTTQELQYALRKFASEKSPYFTENSNKENDPSSSSCEKKEVPLKQAQQESAVGNDAGDSPKHETLVPYQSQLMRKENPNKLEEGLLSSATHSSMEEIWQILERGSSPSILSPQCNNDQEKFQSIQEPEILKDCQEKAQKDITETAKVVALTVKGTKYETQSKVKPSKLPYKQSRKLHTPQQMNKIRNYNIKH